MQIHQPTPTQLECNRRHKAFQQHINTKAFISAKPPLSAVAIAPLEMPPQASVKIRRRYETGNRSLDYEPLYARILAAVAYEFGLTVDQLTGKKRTRDYTIPRFFAVGLLDEMTDMSLPAIGRRLGNRDHTTIIHARRRVRQFCESEAIRNRVDQIKTEIGA